MKIDLHNHCKQRSSCSGSDEEELIESAIKYGLDAIVFSDHDKLMPKDRLEALRQKYSPFKIFNGIEVRTIPNGVDVLVIGVDDTILESKDWTYEKLYKFTKERDGFIALCHPYRYSNVIDIDIATFVPDAVELHSSNIGSCDEELINTLAKRLNMKLLGNSDSHSIDKVGIYYNIIDTEAKDEKELAKALIELPIEIGKDQNRVDEINKEIKVKEDLIKTMISEGKDKAYYNKITGRWIGEFERVELGKSYKI
ncbi:PHP-associated domain-containing protein [Desnuesiella massiliensis]|uniref:PHP-associated domain-containing protein n=1 Tax=Desnuesiella massiliensis TaxID=1650662 RepID=UPI0006E164AC|nr:PHP domain-containing protein [Desnuesiella massiliensis]